jgi:hypothetical protein
MPSQSEKPPEPEGSSDSSTGVNPLRHRSVNRMARPLVGRLALPRVRHESLKIDRDAEWNGEEQHDGEPPSPRAPLLAGLDVDRLPMPS